MDRERVEAIAASVNQRTQLLATFILTQQPQVDSVADDVEENVAAEYDLKPAVLILSQILFQNGPLVFYTLFG